jgi:hypothetical protein
MTREEFEALGITPRDLVCVILEEYLSLKSVSLFKIVGWLNKMPKRDFYEGKLEFGYMEDNSENENENHIKMFAHYIYYEQIKFIEILRKDFWSDND